MKFTIHQLLLLGGVLLLFSNCEKEFFGNKNCELVDGPLVTQIVDISTIHSMDIEVPVDLIIQESETQGIIIESSQAIIDNLLENSFVRNEEWNVQLSDCTRDNTLEGFPVKITASMTALQEIKIAGIGEARSVGSFKNIENLKLEIEGASEFDFAIDSVKNLETKISGLGKFTLAGYAQHHVIDMSGSGEIKAFDLITNTCTIKIDGLGSCEVNVQEALEIDMSGSGEVCYKGQPQLNIDNSGLGEVKDCN